MTTPSIHVGELARNDRGAFKIGPFGSSLKKSELVPSGIPVAGIENILPNEFIKRFRRFVTPKKFEELSDYEIQPGDVLVTTMGTIGRAAVAPLDIGRTIIDSHLFRMRVDTNRVYPRFLCYAINSELVVSQLKRMARGAIMEGLNTGILKECLILLPRLPEQNRIVEILRKADRLRRTRRYARQLSDTFLQSVFLEMFGDPVSNPQHWVIDNLRSLCAKFSDGPFGSNLKTSHYLQEGVRVIRLQNIGVGDFIDDDKAYIAPSHFVELKKHECVPGDVLVGTLGDPNLRACIQPSTIPQALNKADCVQARVNVDRATPSYVTWLLNMPSTIHLAPGIIHGETRSRISMGQLAVLPVPVPPLPLQQKFAAIVQRFERLRAQQREAERQAEHLFQTLLHRAFNGEL